MRIAPLLYTVRRRLLQYPRLSIFTASIVLVSCLYCSLWKVEHGQFGRWYWNYGVSIHPALAYVLPAGDWGPVENPPRWIQEIHDAPWMGHWTIPDLSKPVYNHSVTFFQPSNDALPHRLISPVVAKIHVFSTVKPAAQEKRLLIRKLSPLLNVPPAYRHLVELKFVLGHAVNENGQVDEEMEASLAEEQALYGDLIRLDLAHGENLREGKILDWVRAVGNGEDGGRNAWWLFKVDDDAVLNLPRFLDTLLTLDPHIPHYLGTSLNRWPPYHHHFTGMVTGFSWGLVKTLADGIGRMSRQDIEASWDDDVLTGEIMYCLPSAPRCRLPHGHDSDTGSPLTIQSLPDYCDPHKPPPWGYQAAPPSRDPRTALVRYDFGRRMGDKDVWFVKGDVARHSFWFKFPEWYEKEWRQRIKGKMWKPPKWLKQYADPAAAS
ncbi:hypothetical protein IAR55_005187 [Kwoniella newhampshirensis]|uniref:Hexosyltransferase n=1 Tax=Kwoniella newhampshirensis TaxID=1651941 RepID=A0AAW0YVW4_9TREE